jgi:6-phosphogluconolactonase (cycloisomerase 2 family)
MPVGVLRITGGGLAGREIPLDHDGFTVGRSEEGLGSLGGDPEISRRHARFRVKDTGKVLVEDLGSSNGTYVNGRRITGPRLLSPGDTVKLGETTVTFEIPVSTEAAGPQPTVRARSVSPDTLAAPATAQARAATPPPGGDSSAGAGGGAGRRALYGFLGVLLIAGVIVAVVVLSSGKSNTTGGAPGAIGGGGLPADVQGVVYVESNIAKPDGNSVLALQYREHGDLHPMRLAEYPTGGAGSADLTDSGVLDADQHLRMYPARKLLFAVNQGSDTVAVFHVAGDGSLAPVAGSPFASGGKAPASVGFSGNVAIVANKAQDGVRDLTKVPPTYATFHINSDGSLTQFGVTISAAPGSSPTDAMVGPDGKFVMSTEEGGPFRAFELGAGGLTQGANSPLAPDASIFPAGLDPAKRWGLGISAHPARKIAYVGMATVNKIAVYTYDDTAKLTFVRAVAAPGSMLPCWTLVNTAGTRLYTANAGNNTMSVFDLADPLNPKPLQTLKLHDDGNPWDIRFDPTEKMIFLVDPRARTNVPPGAGQGLHTLLINSNGTLTEPPYSPVVLPVGLNVNPYGMAVLGGT